MYLNMSAPYYLGDIETSFILTHAIKLLPDTLCLSPSSSIDSNDWFILWNVKTSGSL